MQAFMYADVPHPVRDDLRAAQRGVWTWIAQPGSWWTGAQRVAIGRVVRAARAERSEPPWLRRAASHEEIDLVPTAVAAARRVVLEPHRLDRAWCTQVTDELGEASYVELVAVVACVTAIDAFAEALGVALEPLPPAVGGEPSRERPSGVGEDGAWVRMTVPWQGANVGRALSLVPPAALTFGSLIVAMYAGRDFLKLVWEDRPLSRPQVELVAARVSAVNECFY